MTFRNCLHLVIARPECGIHNALRALARKTRLDSGFRRNDRGVVTTFLSFKKYIFLIALFLITALLAFFLLIMQPWSEFRTQSHKYKTLQIAFKNSQNQKNKLSEYQYKINAIQTQLKKTKLESKSSLNTTALLTHLINIIQSLSLQIRKVTPLTTIKQHDFNLLPVEFSLSGQYEQFFQLLLRFNQAQPLIMLKDFKLVHNKQSLQMNILVEVYY